MEQFHGSIINLKQLIYLNISRTGIAKLPDSICSLYNLKTLVVSDFTPVPDHLRSLMNWSYSFSPCSALEEMPLQMGNLKDLEELSDFVVNKYGGSNIKEFGELQQLQGSLRISGLENVGDVEDAVKANLKDKKKLNVLNLQWKGDTDDSIKQRDLLQALKPPTNLREIIILGYGGTSFPLWFGSCSFSKMVSMELSSCQNCCSLPPLGKLPFLKELRIRAFHAVETIGDEFYGCDSPFRSLEMLRFANMPEWNKWSFVEGIKDGAFPLLKTLNLNNCPKLSGGLPISSHTIETLTIEECGKVEIPVSHHVYVLLRKLIIQSSQSIKCFPLEYAPQLNNLTLCNCESFESLTFQEEPLPVLQFLHSMSISGLPKLVSFPKGGLPAPNLKYLSISRCENLRSLPEQMHVLLPTLESLNVIDCPELKSFPEGGLPSNLKTLEIRGCEELVSRCVHWDLRRLTSLELLWLAGCKVVFDSFPPDGLLLSSVTSFSIWNFPQLKALNSNAFQGLTRLGIHCCPELQCLTEESFLDSLQSLEIYKCPLLEQRYRKEKGEGWPKISHIPKVWIGGETTWAYMSDKQ